MHLEVSVKSLKVNQLKEHEMPRTMSNLPHEVEVELISPKKAAEYLDGTFKRNRPIVREVVEMYTTRIEDGDFLNATAIVFASVANEDLVLVDGQHRLSALSKGKKSLKFTVQTYYLNNEEELATLYGTLDIGRARNLNDSVRAHGMPEETGLTQADSTKLASALNFVVHKRPAFNIKGRMSGTFHDQILRAKEWLSEGTWYFDTLKTAPQPMKTIASRKAIVACAMITLRGYPSKSKAFWRGVLLLEDTSPDDVRFKLHMKLVDMFTRSRNTEAKSTHVTCWQCASIVASVWNAYISNRSMAVIKGLTTIVFKRCRWKEEKIHGNTKKGDKKSEPVKKKS